MVDLSDQLAVAEARVELLTDPIRQLGQFVVVEFMQDRASGARHQVCPQLVRVGIGAAFLGQLLAADEREASLLQALLHMVRVGSPLGLDVDQAREELEEPATEVLCRRRRQHIGHGPVLDEQHAPVVEKAMDLAQRQRQRGEMMDECALEDEVDRAVGKAGPGGVPLLECHVGEAQGRGSLPGVLNHLGGEVDAGDMGRTHARQRRAVDTTTAPDVRDAQAPRVSDLSDRVPPAGGRGPGCVGARVGRGVEVDGHGFSSPE